MSKNDLLQNGFESKYSQNGGNQFLKKLSQAAYFFLCSFAFVSVSRNFAGGYEFAGRILPEETSDWVSITVGAAIGLSASYSPLTQIQNSLDKVWEAIANIKKTRHLILPAIFGTASGFSYAQMGASAFSTMISDDWDLGDSSAIKNLSFTVFIITFIAQSFLYTEKVYSLKLGVILKAIQASPLKIIPFSINAAGSIITVVMLQKFGTQAARDYLDAPEIASQFLGAVSAVGPASMCFVDTTLMAATVVKSVKKLREKKHFSLNLYQEEITDSLLSSDERESLSEEQKIQSPQLGWKTLIFALLMSLISAIPNLEYNIDVNFSGFNVLSLVFVIVGTFYNVIPKFVSSIEREHRLQLAKISLPRQSIFQNQGIEGEGWSVSDSQPIIQGGV